jgi:hypothetical protein
MKNTTILASAALLLCSCSAITQEEQTPTPLSVTVTTEDTMTRAAVTTAYLPAGSQIGVTLMSDANTLFDNGLQNASNILFTASSSSGSDTWMTTSPIYLTPEKVTAYAYYPYQEGADIKALSIDTSAQDDWMWSEPTSGINTYNSTAKLYFHHVMSIIRVILIKGSYTGAGEVTSLSIQGIPAATSATLDARDGSLSSIDGQGSPIGAPGMPLTLSTGTTQVDIMAIPTGQTDTITITATVDGQTITYTTSKVTLYNGKYISVNLTLNDPSSEWTDITPQP